MKTAEAKPETRQTIVYVRDGVLILALALGGMYVLVHPEKFDAFLNWTIGRHYRS
jgi:hypothetical protein